MTRTVFWRVAGVLVGVQVATALVAVALSAGFARARTDELVRGVLQLRLDAVAEEVEARAAADPLGGLSLPPRLRLDLPTRFPDPLAVLDASGAVVDTFGARGAVPAVPDDALAALDAGEIAVVLASAEGSWALVPLLAPDGLPAGALLVRPLTATLAEETAGTREAFRQATLVTGLLAALVALALGGALTLALVRPLRRMARRVERLGAALGTGDAPGRLPETPADEFGRLAAEINAMADRVEAGFAALRETDRLRRDLVANVGHDLRTPLAALSALLEEAERHAAAGRAAEAARAVSTARAQAAGATRLVADLFELSLLDRPEARIDTEPVPVGELCAGVAAGQAALFAAAGVGFETDLPPGLPVVQADGARLVRLLQNLLDNARRHTPAGGRVVLRARPADAGGAVVEVEDSGEGIPADELPHVFERHVRGASARTRRPLADGGGSGLGLALARATATAHGGTLDAESAPGEGARFTLRLPAG